MLRLENLFIWKPEQNGNRYEVTFASNNNNFIDIINGIFIFHALFKSINKNKTFICRQID